MSGPGLQARDSDTATGGARESPPGCRLHARPPPLRTLCGGASGCWREKEEELQAGQPALFTQLNIILQTVPLLPFPPPLFTRGILLNNLSNLNQIEILPNHF